MPTGGRKSSFGRSQPQRHVPYSMDAATKGRHGTNIPRQSAQSDGFEDFEAINDIDPTPPRPARERRRSSMGGAKPRKSRAREEEEEDVFGEESMELDDDEPVSRMRNARQHPDSARSSRPISRRASGVDYDALPSPPQRSQRRSSAYSSVLPSEYDPEPDQDMDDVPFFDDDDLPPISDGNATTPTPRARRRESFSEMGEEDQEEEDQPPTPVPVSKKGKGKRVVEEIDDEVQDGPSIRVTGAQRGKGKGKEPIRTVEEEVYDNDMEDAIARGMDEVENMNLDDDEQMQDEDEPAPVSASPPKKKRGRPPKKVAVTPVLDEETPEHEQGPRRGTRQRYAPLEWWRNEKVVYGKRENGIAYCPIVKAIVRVPKEPPKPLGKHARKRVNHSQRRTPALGVANPEEGWDDQTEPQGRVLDWTTKEEVERRIAFPSSHVQYKAANDEMFFFQKIFGDAEYMAAGQLLIPVGGHKPTKTTKDNTYVFYVIEGAVTFKVHETSYILCTGGSILVPRGNTYYIENISDRDAKIFFAQARRPLPDVKPASARRASTSTPAADDGRASESATPVAAPKGKGKKAGGGKKR
ncbi:unnamed protein product [Peniophora sp. CBMAI 1063]|nr:unnamed protein product [Peniophora sp. CBMAI 1063]